MKQRRLFVPFALLLLIGILVPLSHYYLKIYLLWAQHENILVMVVTSIRQAQTSTELVRKVKGSRESCRLNSKCIFYRGEGEEGGGREGRRGNEGGYIMALEKGYLDHWKKST